MIDMIRSVLEPPQDTATLKQMHEDDLETLWLGVTRDTSKSLSNQSHFHDYGRYGRLMLDSQLLGGAVRYPKLVSFVGNTSAGKSTLIKALVSQGGLAIGGEMSDFRTPVPGAASESSRNETRSTSEGVHLYVDPTHLHTDTPILYADCEGLDAGETVPFAEEIIWKHDKSSRIRVRNLNVKSRVIAWAQSNDLERSKRSFAVGHLYPRFLYTFSDVIVFVERTSRQLHKVLTRLVRWAEFHVEKSLNQSRLPRAIVVLNANEIVSGKAADSRWEVNDATNSSFLDAMDEFVSSEQVLADTARVRGVNKKATGAAKALLECYYEEVHFIRIPAKHADRYSLINDQVRKLRNLIEVSCSKAQYEKLISRRLCNADELQEYLHAGFIHFADNLDAPFDFKRVSLRTHAIADDFGDHIVNLARTIQECVRGIVELEILKAIEEKLNVGVSGVRLRVQRFFDLIVGTSTGGIIALSLTAKQRSVDDCIGEFLALCGEAFSERELAGTKLQPLATIAHGSKWRTTPLHRALKKSLGTEPLFGGPTNGRHKYTTKVAVVSASATTSRSLLLTNYNRQGTLNPGYLLEIYDKPNDSMCIWEAAAATSAAPTYFKPFEWHGKTYVDGAINHNNPVVIASRERRLIWPDVSARHPDMFLSLGNGQHRAAIEDQIQKRGKATHRKSKSSHPPRPDQAAQKPDKKRSAWLRIKNLVSVLVSKIDNVLDTEQAWHEFYQDTIGESWSTAESSQYIRINPDLGAPPPALDDKGEVYELQKKVRELVQLRPLASDIEDVANRLVASSFYFKKISIQQSSGYHLCSGSINCKFDSYADYIEKLGFFLKNSILGEFVPAFICTRRPGSGEQFEFKLDPQFIDDMIARKHFKFNRTLDIALRSKEEPMYIMLRLRLESGGLSRLRYKDYPISGFPRKFLVEKERNDTREAKRQEERAKRQNGNRSSITLPPISVTETRSVRPSLSPTTIPERNPSHHRMGSGSGVVSPSDSLEDLDDADEHDLEKTNEVLRWLGDLQLTK